MIDDPVNVAVQRATVCGKSIAGTVSGAIARRAGLSMPSAAPKISATIRNGHTEVGSPCEMAISATHAIARAKRNTALTRRRSNRSATQPDTNTSNAAGRNWASPNQTSNNSIRGPYCMYGDTSFKISQNNLIQCGVVLMTPSPDTYHNGTPPTPTDECSEDYGNLSNDEMIAQAFSYGTLPIVADLEYANAKAVLTRYVNSQSYNDPFGVIPPWVTQVQSPSINAFNNDSRKGKLVAGTLYHVKCNGTNKKLELTGFVQNVAVFTDCEVSVTKDKDVSAEKPTKTETGKQALCDPDDKTCDQTDWLAEIDPNNWSCEKSVNAGFESYTTLLDTAGSGTYKDGTADAVAEDCGIEPGANGLWDNVFVFTTHLEGGNVDQKAITFPNNMQLGRIDGCTEGGGVRIYSAGSIDTPSGTIAHGVQIVTLGSVQFAAKADGAMGLNIQAMGDIKYTANGATGGCSTEPASKATEVVLTVRPVALVE